MDNNKQRNILPQNQLLNEEDIIRSVPKNKCYICGSSSRQVYSNLNDRLFGASGLWNLNQCENQNCRLMWLDPMPIEEDIGKAYKNYYTHGEIDSAVLPFFRPLEKGYLNIKFNYYKEASLRDKILGLLLYIFPTETAEVDFSVMYLKAKENGRLLDVGCGNGWLMQKMKRLNWDVEGVDFDPKAVEYCRANGLTVHPGSLQTQNLPENSFDVITINHVIEHIHDPLDLLKECYRILKPGGSLVIATPNTSSWLHKVIYKKNWFPLDPPRHLILYNPKNLEVLVKKAGFNEVDSTSTIRNEFWVYIGSRSIKKTSHFQMGGKKQPKFLHLIGRLVQLTSWLVVKFNRDAGGEVRLTAKK